jgi:hypothetical protein
MDTFLANYFGTNQGAPEQTTETDELEKMAQLVMLDKIAEDQGVDLSGLSDEEYLQLAGQEKVASEQGGEYLTEHEKIAAAKFEEATYLGKVVAHSMWNELEAIQKEAKKVELTGPTGTLAAGLPGGKREEAIGRLSDADLSKYIKQTSRAKKLEALKGKAKDVAAKGAEMAKGVGKTIAKHPGKAALIGGGAALAAGGAAYGAKKMKEKSKEGSAFDTLSDARAYEILQENGLADEQGNIVAPDQISYEKTAADKLAEAVEQEAWLKLAELGYPVVSQ